MNRFPYRDAIYEGIIIGGHTYDSEREYERLKMNFNISVLLHLKELGCNEIIKRLIKK